MKKKRKEMSSKELYELLKYKKIRLDCGHYCSIGHNFSNTLIVHPNGKMQCHECGY